MRLFDDDMKNLKMFLGLKKEYPDVSFEAFLANPDGRVRKVN
jgi:hypothetical protein